MAVRFEDKLLLLAAVALLVVIGVAALFALSADGSRVNQQDLSNGADACSTPAQAGHPAANGSAPAPNVAGNDDTVSDHIPDNNDAPAPMSEWEKAMHREEEQNAKYGFINKQTSGFVFDWSHAPAGATGTLLLHAVPGPGYWQELNVADRPGGTRRLPAGEYQVLIVGDVPWQSAVIKLEPRQWYTMNLWSGGAAPARTVTVKVVDNETGEPIQGAGLLLNDLEVLGPEPEPKRGILALTDGTGQATLEGQPSVSTYTVHKFGYDAERVSTNGHTDLGTISLSKSTGTIQVAYDLSTLEVPPGWKVFGMVDIYELGTRGNADGWQDEGITELKWAKKYKGFSHTGRFGVSVYVAIENPNTGDRRVAKYLNNDVRAGAELALVQSDFKVSREN